MGFIFIALVLLFAAVHMTVLSIESYNSLRSCIIKRYIRRMQYKRSVEKFKQWL